MAKRTCLILLLLGFLGACAATFIPGAATRLSSYWTATVAPHSAASHARVSTARPGMPIQSKNDTASRVLQTPPWDALYRTTAARRAHERKSASMAIPSWQRLLAQSAPKARELFETGLAFLRDGRYTEARLTFQNIIRDYPGDKAVALAYWARGLSFYREGGEENLLLAMDQFMSYSIFFPADRGPADLAEAAQTNIAVIASQAMDSARTEAEKIEAAQNGLRALNYLVVNCPYSPAIPAAEGQIMDLESYLSTVSPQRLVFTGLVVKANKMSDISNAYTTFVIRAARVNEISK
ncbi:MAG: hypothetical protein LAP85_16260 [Acidobacteriia bacterium]|nr:hypothetical protein [Terriglobia bacterium]